MDTVPDSPQELLSIQEVASQTGIPPATIRYYDQQFEEYLQVKRGSGRRRLFSPQAVERLLAVRRMLKDEGLSIRQVRQKLSGGAPLGPSSGETAQLRQEVARLKAQVDGLESQLRDLKDIQKRTLALVDGLAGK